MILINNPKTIPVVGAALLLLLITALPGCSLFGFFSEKPIHLEINARIYPSDSYTVVRRVLFYPLSNETAFQSETNTVAEAFADELAERGCFELIRISEEDETLFGRINSSGSGGFPLSLLIELGSYYKVDAVLVSTLKIYNPYAPQAIGMKSDLISVHNGKVLRSLNGTLDANSDMVSRDMSHYYEEECAHDGSMAEPRLIGLSPHFYARYACNRFIKFMFPRI